MNPRFTSLLAWVFLLWVVGSPPVKAGPGGRGGSNDGLSGGPVHVSGYLRSNGTYVSPYYRSRPGYGSPGRHSSGSSGGSGDGWYGGYDPGPAHRSSAPPKRPTNEKDASGDSSPWKPGTVVVVGGAPLPNPTGPFRLTDPWGTAQPRPMAPPPPPPEPKRQVYLHSYVNEKGVTVWEYRYRTIP